MGAAISPASALAASGMNPEVLRTLDTLRKDEWKEMDLATISAAQNRLVLVGDLISRGLTKNIPNGLGKMVYEYEDVSDMNAADTDMDGNTQGDNDRVLFSLNGLPLPITHKAHQIGARTLAASRNSGASLDTIQAALAGRKVAEKLEDMLVNGISSWTYGGYTVYGYVNEPNRNTYTLPLAWDDASVTPALILADVLAMKQSLITANMYGGVQVYISTNYETVLDEDYKSTSAGMAQTIRQRLLAVEGVEGIKVADHLADDTVLMIRMVPDVVQWVTGMPITNVEWQNPTKMTHFFKTMTIQVPRIRADQGGNSGIVHATV